MCLPFPKSAIDGRSSIRFDRGMAVQYLETAAPGIGDLVSKTHAAFAIARANTGVCIVICILSFYKLSWEGL